MSLQSTIEQAFEERAQLTPDSAPEPVRDAVQEALQGLNDGSLRVAEPADGGWVVNEWLKKAVLLSFCITDNEIIDGGHTRYRDKVAGRFALGSEEELDRGGVRIVPPATARFGSFIAPGVVLMPSFVNIGAYVDSGTMVDHLGDGRFLRPDRQERPSLRRRRHWRRAGTAAGRPHHHRG